MNIIFLFKAAVSVALVSYGHPYIGLTVALITWTVTRKGREYKA